ncbi:GNAT family N-acetyltransferase [Thalassotalea euphylliae]|uniref:GNAT family N-acetyltransferase n=1 Tax=Thalassotalea euphylliae TaxID=1655234 RepID=UPI00363CA133
MKFTFVSKENTVENALLANIWRENLAMTLPELPKELASQLVESQYAGMLASYHSAWPMLHKYLIQSSGQTLGLIVLNESDSELLIVDFIICPQYRNKGHGSNVLRWLINYCFAKNIKTLRLSVQKTNKAIQLYLAHQFVVSGVTDTHLSMVLQINNTQRH